MFRDGYLTYAGAQSAFRNWRPESDTLYELIFAVLVTVFVYQLTKLLLELSLGQRRKGEIMISDLYVYMVVTGLSLSALVSNVLSLCRGIRGDTGEERSAGHGAVSHKPGRAVQVVVKFMLLLLCIPSIHILGIFLSIESESELSFKDVHFGGLGMGLREDANLKTNNFSTCPKVKTSLAQGETGVCDFFRCFTMSPPIPFDNEGKLENGSFIAILRSSTDNVGVTIVAPGKRWISFLTLSVNDGNQTYILKNALSSEQRSEIFEAGVRELVARCESPKWRRDIDISWVIPPSAPNEPQQDILKVLVECSGYDEAHNVRVATGMLDRVSFVQTERFEVYESLFSQEVVAADELSFLRRRGSNASLLAMVISSVTVIVCRIVLSLFLNNEGAFALEVIIKERFGLRCCDSMLQYEQKVEYGEEIEGTKTKTKTKTKMYEVVDDIESSSSSSSQAE